MSNRLDYADYPTHEQWNRLFDRKGASFRKILLKEKSGKQTYSILGSEGIMNLQLDFWINEYNQKAFDLINNYILVMHHYGKGIPDTEWVASNENGGVTYFPHFEEKHEHIIYWFHFYMDSYYPRFSSLLDTIYHIINVKNYLGIEPVMGFNSKVSKALKPIDEELHNYLQSIRQNDIYKSVEHFRNDITHNFKPNHVNSGITQRNENGQLIISGGVGTYTTTTDFVVNIEASIDLLAEIIDTIRDKLQAD
ncbi:Cthe_2314 family HEPN domain-containing protein [Fictibacillus sp. S7]|uniref:Cthe_2314 family HEPN domain-containing protein n=1 Tax=Fictibacillus sp. S7 TaxID=2212476 RepID=UPI001011717B|nr:Cthe_2314 family HEPN domain-containing protein [Fictibacillus sp. S7]RXY98560.1 hypothetical protein DMO16_02130 [Fictibacillus sp. S7]